MSVLRIVLNVEVDDPAAAQAFYGDVLGLRQVMNHGFITTFADEPRSQPQISFATEGGSGTPVPDISIEVDDLEAVLQRVRSGGYEIVYGPAEEPWGVRRFYVRDPFGKLVNILTHL